MGSQGAGRGPHRRRRRRTRELRPRPVASSWDAVDDRRARRPGPVQRPPSRARRPAFQHGDLDRSPAGHDDLPPPVRWRRRSTRRTAARQGCGNGRRGGDSGARGADARRAAPPPLGPDRGDAASTRRHPSTGGATRHALQHAAWRPHGCWPSTQAAGGVTTASPTRLRRRVRLAAPAPSCLGRHRRAARLGRGDPGTTSRAMGWPSGSSERRSADGASTRAGRAPGRATHGGARRSRPRQPSSRSRPWPRQRSARLERG